MSRRSHIDHPFKDILSRAQLELDENMRRLHRMRRQKMDIKNEDERKALKTLTVEISLNDEDVEALNLIAEKLGLTWSQTIRLALGLEPELARSVNKLNRMIGEQ